MADILIRYGGVEFLIASPPQINYTAEGEIDHNATTDRNDYNDAGQRETSITCTVLASGLSQLISLESLIMTRAERELEIYGQRIYKRVVPPNSWTLTAPYPDKTEWQATVTFKALDPYPYDPVTDDKLY